MSDTIISTPIQGLGVSPGELVAPALPSDKVFSKPYTGEFNFTGLLMEAHSEMGFYPCGATSTGDVDPDGGVQPPLAVCVKCHVAEGKTIMEGRVLGIYGKSVFRVQSTDNFDIGDKVFSDTTNGVQKAGEGGDFRIGRALSAKGEGLGWVTIQTHLAKIT